MSVIEIILLAAGVLVFVGSFFLPDKGGEKGLTTHRHQLLETELQADRKHHEDDSGQEQDKI